MLAQNPTLSYPPIFPQTFLCRNFVSGLRVEVKPQSETHAFSNNIVDS